jgi:ADP-ribose pyrophosphatase YjhB (NUDIX family)
MNTTNLHEDQSIRIDNERHAAIILKEEKLLVIYRILNGFKFYTIPGGHRQKGEEPIDTVKREVNEETSLITTEPILMFEFRDYKKNNFDFYYLCEWVEGEARFNNSEEQRKNSPENYYEHMWIDLDKISELNLLPRFAKEWIEKNLVKNPI